MAAAATCYHELVRTCIGAFRTCTPHIGNTYLEQMAADVTKTECRELGAYDPYMGYYDCNTHSATCYQTVYWFQYAEQDCKGTLLNFGTEIATSPGTYANLGEPGCYVNGH